MAVVRRLEGVHLLHDRGQDLFERVVLVLDLIGLVAEVAAGLGAFHHEGVGQIVEAGEPFAGDQGRRAGGRDDGDQLGLELFLFFFAGLQEMLGHLQGQTGTGKDDVGTVFDGRAHHLAERGQRHHDVDADDALGLFPGLGQLLAQGAQVGFDGVLGHVGLFHPDHGSGDDADAALIGNSRGEAGKGNANTHAALDDGHFSGQVSNGQRRKSHDATSNMAL